MSNFDGSFSGHAMPVMDGNAIKATVKWFNPQKGFGFVAPEDGQGDAFLHISALLGAGMSEIADGTEIMCSIAPGAKGRQVQQISEVLGVNPNFTGGGQGGGARAPRAGGFERRERSNFGGGYDDDGAEETSVSGTVKWFKQDKGFGFIAGDDNGPDIFVHKSLLRRCNIMVLDSGMKVDMRCKPSPKGREATWIRVTD